MMLDDLMDSFILIHLSNPDLSAKWLSKAQCEENGASIDEKILKK